MIVLHYTGMSSAKAALERLCDPAAEVSAHYLVEENGRIVQMVAEERRAWHAGVSGWAGTTDINSCSIGIELANPGPSANFPPFPHAMMRALEALVGDVRRRLQIPPERVVGHSCIAPGRKIDPGLKFDWRAFAGAGHSIWLPPPREAAVAGGDPDRFRRAARTFGYPVDDDSGWTAALAMVWDAYALRFLSPSPLATRRPCAAGVAHLESLASRWPSRPMVPDLDPDAAMA